MGNVIVELTSPSNSSRRTVIRGVAWTAPVVAVAVAAPSFAATPTLGRFVSFLPSYVAGGTKQYTISTVIDPGPLAVTSLQVRFTLSGNSFTAAGAPAGWSTTVIFVSGQTVITYSYDAVPLLANFADISAAFQPVRQGNTAELLTVALIINSAVVDTRTYTNPTS